jgi:hypothetical protein
MRVAYDDGILKELRVRSVKFVFVLVSPILYACSCDADESYVAPIRHRIETTYVSARGRPRTKQKRVPLVGVVVT